VSLVIVVIFILCHSLRWIPNIWELKHSGLKKVTGETDVIHPTEHKECQAFVPIVRFGSKPQVKAASKRPQ
jgi:hypothetical protein